MEANKNPEIAVSEVVLNSLRGLRLSNSPRVAEIAAQREQEELERLEKLHRSDKRRKRQPIAA